MAEDIRIEADGWFVAFRPDRWTFGDRRKIMEAESDWDALNFILPYVTSWNLKDVDGIAVMAKDGEGRPVSSLALANLDDDTARWLVRAWFQAKAQRAELPKVP